MSETVFEQLNKLNVSDKTAKKESLHIFHGHMLGEN